VSGLEVGVGGWEGGGGGVGRGGRGGWLGEGSGGVGLGGGREGKDGIGKGRTLLWILMESSSALFTPCSGNSVHLINHGLGDKLLVSMTDTTLSNFTESQRKCTNRMCECAVLPALPPPTHTHTRLADSAPHAVAWQLATEEDQGRGFRLCIRHSKVGERSNITLGARSLCNIHEHHM